MYALASDFDGTLFFDQRNEKISKDDIKSIKQWQQNGQLFGICTGRPLSGVDEYLSGLLDLDFMIVSSGGLILNKNREVIYEQCLDENIVEEIVMKYQNDYHITIQANGYLYALKNHAPMPIKQIVINQFKQIPTKHIYGISIATLNNLEAKLLTNKLMSDYQKSIAVFQNNQYIDIVAINCSKGNAVNYIKEVLNIDMMSGIGDSYNDLSLLEACDYSFTFNNSPEMLKKKAHHIVGSINEALKYLNTLQQNG